MESYVAPVGCLQLAGLATNGGALQLPLLVGGDRCNYAMHSRLWALRPGPLTPPPPRSYTLPLPEAVISAYRTQHLHIAAFVIECHKNEQSAAELGSPKRPRDWRLAAKDWRFAATASQRSNLRASVVQSKFRAFFRAITRGVFRKKYFYRFYGTFCSQSWKQKGTFLLEFFQFCFWINNLNKNFIFLKHYSFNQKENFLEVLL